MRNAPAPFRHAVILSADDAGHLANDMRCFAFMAREAGAAGASGASTYDRIANLYEKFFEGDEESWPYRSKDFPEDYDA